MKGASGITSEVLSCTGAETSYQDRRLNRAYQQLLAIRSAAAREQLRQRERAWMVARDQACKPNPAKTGGGTLTDEVYADCILQQTGLQADRLTAELQGTH